MRTNHISTYTIIVFASISIFLSIPLDIAAQCTDPLNYADSCDFDGDLVLNIDDSDDDNDGILDVDEICNPARSTSLGFETAPAVCSGSADLHSNGAQRFGINEVAQEGSSFAGLHPLIGSPQTQGESISVPLSTPLIAGEIANISFHLAVGRLNGLVGHAAWGPQNLGDNPGYFEIWGGSSSCASTELLYTSQVVPNDAAGWVFESGTFSPTNSGITHLRIIPFGSLTGNHTPYMLIDGLQICEVLDTDADDIPNFLDHDSDNDGCPDAIEGGGSFTATDLKPDSSLGTIVDANGIPTIAGTPQGVGSSINSSVQDPNCPSGLPITWLHFHVKPTQRNNALLNWGTQTELNNAGFEIEHALPTRGAPIFNKIGFVEGYGTTIEAKSYYFKLSNLAAGTHYFRLKQVDFDGSFQYSELKALTINAVEGNTIALYPNPARDRVYIDFANKMAGKVTIQVMDNLGKVISVQQTSQQHLIMIDSQNLSNGTYIVRINTEQETQCFQLLVKHF